MKPLKHMSTSSAWAYLSRHGKCWSDTRLGNTNIGMQEGIHDGGLWGLDDLLESVKKHDEASERIRKRDGVKIKSKAIVLKNNLAKKKPPKFKELIVPSVQSTNALTMDLRSKKVLQLLAISIVLFELYNHHWPWNEKGEEVKFQIREKERTNRDAPRSEAKPKQKVALKKLKRTQKALRSLGELQNKQLG